jgi:tRNA nucleotidyltransferase/poly(A) polymerase
MSDYMFMLESHLSPDQNRVLGEVQAAAAEANMSVFLTGGAMRDVMGGFAVRDLDFTVEGNALKLARTLAKKTGAEITFTDERRKCAELLFPGQVTVEIAMARQERYAKPGAQPQVEPATIHEDLRRRDFTINAVALSLNRASRGLLIDPTNGLGDLARKELRAVHNYTLYDEPARILRLVRFRVRLGLTVEERTAQQYENVRSEGLERRIPPRRLLEELREIAEAPNPGEVLRALHDEKLLPLFSPALAEGKLNLVGLAKLHRAKQLIPYGVPFPVHNLPLLLSLMSEKLTANEKARLVAACGIGPADVSAWHRLEARATRLEQELKSPKLHKPFQVYEVLSEAPGELVLYLLVRSSLRLVQDRIRNFLQRYLPAALEVTDQEVLAQGGQPGTPKFRKIRNELIEARLNARAKHPAPEEEAATPEAAPEEQRAARRLDARQPKVSRA